MRAFRSARAPLATAADVALALAVVAAQVIGSALVASDAVGVRPLDWLGYALLVTGGASLMASRRRPNAVMAATVTAGFVYDALSYPGALYIISIYVAVFIATVLGQRVWMVAVAALSTYGLFLAEDVLFVGGHTMDVVGSLFFVGWMTLSVLAGEVVRNHRARLAEAERHAVEAERLRIARELHDVLAHSISIIKIQAGVAAHLLDTQPEYARRALLAINETSKEALRELRGTLGVLRQVDEEAPPRAPAPSLARLDELVAGVPLQVDVSVTGAPRPLPAQVDLAAYRIAQESLTNVARHAGQASAKLSLTYGPHDLILQIDDNGRGVPDIGHLAGGTGLLGMRERAAATGGELEAGPGPRGGFRVWARLPLDGTS
ncbi:MAG: sensor histidine kinase [Egibacteraceae bacterium]